MWMGNIQPERWETNIVDTFAHKTNPLYGHLRTWIRLVSLLSRWRLFVGFCNYACYYPGISSDTLPSYNPRNGAGSSTLGMS